MYNETTIDIVKSLAKGFENHVNNMYKIMHERNSLRLMSGGKLRKFSGKIQEQAMLELITNTCLAGGLCYSEFAIEKGDAKHNGLLVSNSGGSIRVGVDWHLYIKGRLVLINECKSYLDTAFLSRAYSYMDKIKSVPGNENVKSIVTSMETAIDYKALAYYMYDSVIDRCYFFLSGSRQSVKPIYLIENWKPINRSVVEDMITFILGVIKENIYNGEVKQNLQRKLSGRYEKAARS
ncbi:hypothetical protein KAU51_03905 [Candidatus Parcubacteria bacterium]|nr:hypothetical protein [Candidatus Parcubacteria bacterium]